MLNCPATQCLQQPPVGTDFGRETIGPKLKEQGGAALRLSDEPMVCQIITLETNALTLRVCSNPQFLTILPKFTLKSLVIRS